MRTSKLTETIHACRFCFMCRHLSAVGNVTYRESDTPRGRALVIDKITRDPRWLELPDFQSTLYDADLSAACRNHCVSHYDEAGLVLAARRDLVESGHAAANVIALADEAMAVRVGIKGDPEATLVYCIDHDAEVDQPEIADAMATILEAACRPAKILTGADSGKILSVLGFQDKAAHWARAFVEAVGAGTATIVASSPAVVDFLRNDLAGLGVRWGGSVEVLHSSQFLLKLLAEGKLAFSTLNRKVYPIPSDFLRNYGSGETVPQDIARALGITLVPFGHNQEESYTAGEGALVLDRLNPKLAAKLAAYVADRVDDPERDELLVFSPYTKKILRQHAGKPLNLVTVEELAAGAIRK